MGRGRRGFHGFSHNPADYAAEVRCPTLLLQRDRDARVRLPEAQAIAGRLRTMGQLVDFAEFGHESCPATQPERWRAAVKRLLD